MAQVFISYSRSEKQAASLIAQRLTEAGYDVWWDADILGGTRFEDEINNVLRKAPVAIILWSKSAASSDWVRAEAEVARNLRSALPVVIDDVDISALPILFQQINIIELRNWDGNTGSPGYQQVLKTLADRIGSTGRVDGQPSRGSKPAPPASAASLAEADAWTELLKIAKPVADDYRDFLHSFPDGQFAAVAQTRLKRIERRNSRFWRFFAVTAVLVVALGAVSSLFYEPVRDRLLSVLPHDPGCAPDSVVSLALISRFEICLDPRLWRKLTMPGAPPAAQFYGTSDGTVVMLMPNLLDVPADIARPNVVVTSDRTSTVNLLSTDSQQFNDLPWTVWHWNAVNPTVTTNFISYYHDAPGVGSMNVTFYSYAPDPTIAVYATSTMPTAKFRS